MSGFGYVRDSKPVVTDWAQVGRDMGKVITDEFADRDKRKADIEKQSAEIAKNLLDSPVGQYEEANRFASDFSSQAQQQALSDLRLLKNNQISEREYYNRRANLKSGTDLMFTAVRKFNENYDTAMQNILDGKSSVLLSDLKAQMQGYLNFADSGTYINPATGSVNVSKLNPDGTVSTNPANFMNAGMLLKLSTTDFKTADLDKKIKSVQERLGSIKYTDEAGRTQSISLFDLNLLSDIEKNKLMQSKDFKSNLNDALEDEVEAIVGNVNSNNAASILADYSGEKYSLSFDPKLFNEKGELINPKAKTNEIAYSPNGQVTLTEGQLEKAKEVVRRRLQRGLDFATSKKSTITDQTSRTRRGGNAQLKADSTYELAYKFTRGQNPEFVLEQIKSTEGSGVKDVVNLDDRFIVQYNRDESGNIPESKVITKVFTEKDGRQVYDPARTAILMTSVIDPKISTANADEAYKYYMRTKGPQALVSTDFETGDLQIKNTSDLMTISEGKVKGTATLPRLNLADQIRDVFKDTSGSLDDKAQSFNDLLKDLPDSNEKNILQQMNLQVGKEGLFNLTEVLTGQISPLYNEGLKKKAGNRTLADYLKELLPKEIDYDQSTGIFKIESENAEANLTVLMDEILSLGILTEETDPLPPQNNDPLGIN